MKRKSDWYSGSSIWQSLFPVTKSQLLDCVGILVKYLKIPNKLIHGHLGRGWYDRAFKYVVNFGSKYGPKLTATIAAVTERSIRFWLKEISDYFVNMSTKRMNLHSFFAAKENSILVMNGSRTLHTTDERRWKALFDTNIILSMFH